ncbi:MAG: hypothetical protein ACE5NN_03220, partial [Candidatus Bathyarchaeia archaeon]
MRFKTFGWNGFVFEIPRDMYLVSEGGNSRSGYMRLDAENYFFEVKWEGEKPKKVKPLEEIVHSFVEKLEKDSRQKFTVRGKKSTYVHKHDALLINIESNLEERIYIWYCSESLRVIIFRFAFVSPDNVAGIIKRTLTSLKCHGEEMNRWTMLESSFKAPPSFLLTERKIMVGRTYLLLVEEELRPVTERRREILFEYFTTANVRFEEDYMDIERWMKKRYLKDLKKRYRIKFLSTKKKELNNHKAIVKKGVGSGGLLTRKSSLYTNVSWYCEDLNRIYSVTVSEHIARPLPLKRKIDEKAFEDF